MKKIFLLFCAVFLLIGCEKDDTPDEVKGKWRLESLNYPMINETITYNNVNIVFSFDINSVTVTGNDGSFYIENGVYPYSLTENNNNSYTMKIGVRDYPCSFEKGKMIFSWAYVDGEVITFRKL